MQRITLIVVCVVAVFASVASADVFRTDNGAVIPGTEGIEPGPGVNLSDLDLSFAKLDRRNLTGALFTTSNLTSATFKTSNLTDASLTAANLSNVDLDRATLTNTNFANVVVKGSILTGTVAKGFTKEQLYSTASYKSGDLRGVNLANNNLEGWNFSGKDLTNGSLGHLKDGNLRAANLTGALIGTVDVTNADFADAVIAGVKLNGSWGFTEGQLYSTASYQANTLGAIGLNGQMLSGWQFQGQHLQNAEFNGADLTGANLTGANLSGARLEGATLTNTDLAGALIAGAVFNNTTSSGFTAAMLYSTMSHQTHNLQGIWLRNNDLTGWDFSDQNLTGASISGTLTDADFTGAIVKGASISGLTKEQLYSTASDLGRDLGAFGFDGDLTAWQFQNQNLAGAWFSNATLVDADFSGANLAGAAFSLAANATGARFTGANLSGANLERVDLTGAQFDDANLQGARLRQAKLAGANLDGASIQRAILSDLTAFGFTKEQLYSTASYQAHDLQGVVFGVTARPEFPNDFSGWDFSNQNLSETDFNSVNVSGASFAGAIIKGAKFPMVDRFGFTKEMLYSTASYTEHDLGRIYLPNSNLADWDFSHQNLADATLTSSNVTNANFSFADTRGAQLDLSGAITINTIRADGLVQGLTLAQGDVFIVRDHSLAITINEMMSIADGASIQLRLNASPWNSLISFQENIPVQLGGTLELAFTPETNVLTQVGRTIHIFDWTGVEPTGAFTVASQYPWDLSELYTTGEVTLLLPGDTNGDQQVNIADLNNVRNNFGAAGGLGDTNGDQLVDIQDLNNVRHFFGATAPQAVPEPTSLMLLGFAVTGACAFQCGRRRFARAES